MDEALRTCKICGLQAFTEEELNLFTKDKNSLYGRTLLCKSCQSERVKNYYEENDTYYLKRVLFGIKRRCNDPRHVRYKYYGGKGIIVTKAWDNPETFVEWALNNGFKRGLYIDRIDNDGNYEPSNCRWVTHLKNMRNKTNSKTNYVKRTRICYKCKIEKPLTDFPRNKSKPLGYGNLCKKCDAKEHRGRRGKLGKSYRGEECDKRMSNNE